MMMPPLLLQLLWYNDVIIRITDNTVQSNAGGRIMTPYLIRRHQTAPLIAYQMDDLD